MLPVGGVVPVVDTLALKVTLWPEAEGLAVLVRVVVVAYASLDRTEITGVLLEALLESPLYTAEM
jgi:hypothetical protein